MTAQQDPKRRLYRDPDAAVLAGVCAGVANYFGFNRGALRLVWGIGFLFFWPAVLYLILALILPREPKDLFQSPAQEEFYRGINRDPLGSFGELRLRFRDLDLRLQKMEKHVTSKAYNFDREIRG